MKKPTLSACIITDNNPKVLNAIKSIYDSVDEIILVNTVKEFTLGISKLNKVKLFQFDWNDNFSEARNFAIKQATGDYILKIDSDEVMSEPIRIKPDDDFHYYSFKVMNGKFPARDIRIFKNGLGIKYSGMVHETVEDSISDNKVCKVNDVTFIHSGLDDIDTIQRKIERNHRILNKDLGNPLRNYHLCNLYFGIPDYEQCIQYGFKALQDNIAEERKGYIYIQIFNSFEKLKLVCLQKSLELIPIQIYARVQVINELVRDKQYKIAVLELEKVLSIIQNKNSNLPNDVYPEENYIKNKIKELKKCE